MEKAVASSALVAGYIGGWEIVLILAVVLLLYGAARLPPRTRGFGRGFHEFRKATSNVGEELQPIPDESGLVYEALTHDNRTAEFIYPRRSDFSETLRAMIVLVAQGFGVGRIRLAPGTFGSLVGLAWFLALVATKRYEVFLLSAACGAGLSVWLCGAAEKILQQKDPPSVVLDEIVALPFCFLPWVTTSWLKTGKLPALETFLAGPGLFGLLVVFVLFRVFDIWKPWPIRQSQRLPGGWGVTMDDLLAAVYVGLLSLVWVR